MNVFEDTLVESRDYRRAGKEKVRLDEIESKDCPVREKCRSVAEIIYWPGWKKV